MRFNKFFSYCLLLTTFCLLAISSCAPPSAEQKSLTKTVWVEATLKRLTLEEKIGQMVMSRAMNYYYSDESDQFRRCEHLVREHKIGGFIFFQGDVYETAVLANRLQALSDVPLLIASDFEWGSAMRVRRTTRFPEAMALGATRDTVLAFDMGKVVAEESRAIGVHQNLAPVADVNVNPENPVINTRSFGENPELVANMASAFASGLQSGGVLATAKHFPGHGDTQVDPHLDLPVLSISRPRMDSIELLPFKQLIQHGVASIMVAHFSIPAVEPIKGLPSVLSHSVITDLLKNKLGFNGLIVPDALEMGAIVKTFGSDTAAVRAVEAGNDMLYLLEDEDGGITALINAVAHGRITEERINQSVRKILGIKFDVGLAENRTVDVNEIPRHVETSSHLSLAKEISRRAITVLKNDGMLPLEQSGAKKILNVVVSDVEDYRTEIHRTTSPWPNEPVGDYFTAQLRKRYTKFETVRIDPSNNEMGFEDILRKAEKADIILCSIFSKARSGSGKFGLPPEIVDFLWVITDVGTPTIAIAMGSPYILTSIPNARAYICSYSDCEPVTEATVEALFGEIPTRGKLPVTIPNMFAYGTGIEMGSSALRKDVPETVGFIRDSLTRVDSVITKAIRDSAFPGAHILIAKDGAVIYNRAFGKFEYADTSRRVNLNTMYDLASVTKVIATTSAVMKLYDDGKLRLDDLVTKYIPEFGNHGKDNITIRNLLLHNAGLPPFKRLFLSVTSPQSASGGLDSVYQTEMIYKTGDSTLYSDFDFILLGKIVERISGITLDRYTDSVFFSPLGMTRTMFKPSTTLLDNIAPTEFDSVVRKAIVRGTVHDENAYVLGGVAGHAGLFSTASDLAMLMQMLMNGGNYGGKEFLKSETVKLFTTKQNSRSSRALGWDTKTMNGYSSAGSLFSANAFGHTGFTGTSIWADPEKKIFVILLTNRVYPTRNNLKIMQVRPAVHDAVMRALK